MVELLNEQQGAKKMPAEQTADIQILTNYTRYQGVQF